MRQDECSSLLIRWLWPSQPMTPSISSTWWTELTWTTNVEISRQGWWTSESHGSYHTGGGWLSFPPLLQPTGWNSFFTSLKNWSLSSLFLKKSYKKIHKETSHSLCLWLSISLFLSLNLCEHSLVLLRCSIPTPAFLLGYPLFLKCLQCQALAKVEVPHSRLKARVHLQFICM